jgi:hypothetical protein
LLTGLLDAFTPDMLVIADRNFDSFEIWKKALTTGADLLWRVTASVSLPVIEALPDGSYRSIGMNPRITGARRKTLIEQFAADRKSPRTPRFRSAWSSTRSPTGKETARES